MKIWTTCPDCMRSDGHHPLCPSEDLPLAGEVDIDDQADHDFDAWRDSAGDNKD